MRLAYLATDKSSVKTAALINKYYTSVDYYFIDSEPNSMDLEIDRLPIMAKNLCIPTEKALQTTQHQAVLKSISRNLNDFMNQIYVFKNLSIELVDTAEKTNYRTFQMSDISFIKYNKEINKYTIENSQQEIIEYDYLLVENNQIIMNAILDKQQNLFLSFTEQTKVLLSLEFKIVNHHQSPQMPTDFIYVASHELKTTEDNWYVCRLEDHKIIISFYIPIEMHNSDSYTEFIVNRVNGIFNEVSDSFKLTEFIGKKISAIDGHYAYKAKLRQSKNGALIPTFTFWSHDKINHYLNQVLKSKNKTTGEPRIKMKPEKVASL